ncbi:MAG TPA: VWA domain-containing protein [Terriglobales bacterium]|nr:VWA domain-containing protein [Terriglobales bacterium]
MLAHWHVRSAFLVSFALAVGLNAQDSGAGAGGNATTFYSNVSEVRVTFYASDGKGRRLPVSSRDFAIVDNGVVIRNFRSFGRSNETQVDMVALVDVSDSVTPSFRVAMNDVLQLVSREQAAPDGNIAVLSFGGLRPAVLCASGCRTPGATSTLLGVRSGGLTPLHDGLVFGADFVARHRRPGVRPVLILFSDGRDTISMHSAREALDAAVNSGALLYAVDTGTSGEGSDGSAFLRGISTATGGRYFSVHDGAATILKAVLDDLSSSYVVTYEPPRRQNGFHSIRLLPTRNLNLRFHNRTGYYYEPRQR